MRPLCIECHSRIATRRAQFVYCWRCYSYRCGADAKLGKLPADHPFIKERDARVERMIERAKKHLPLFDE